ncbi:Uncharacterized protein NEOC65_000770 [Neochlamydia sp. AcF65]|uniref:hypothetical protein n=1 Tax=Neochlamydia sp. AcF65 TaxID=2795735 RepID=UPI001BC94F82|nr:hypothetical protein [Neochlamydia sp. AcF65]MBS4165705.1 Uncharacterized protein [Neochlamydia sp. AcF65]
MANNIMRICSLGDHFWYPEINKQINLLIRHPRHHVEVDCKVLYKKHSKTLARQITVIASKIFHSLKLFFLFQYRLDFDRAVKTLIYSEEIKSRVFSKPFIASESEPLKLLSEDEPFKPLTDVLVAEKIAKREQLALFNKRNQAAIAIQRFYRKMKYIDKKIEEEKASRIHVLNAFYDLIQYSTHKENLKRLDENLNSQWRIVSFFKSESDLDQHIRLTALEQMKTLREKLWENAKISSSVKIKIDDENLDPATVLKEINREISIQGTNLAKIDKRIIELRSQKIAK